MKAMGTDMNDTRMHEQDGFSFLEAMISTTMLVVLMGSLFTVFNQSQVTFEAQEDAIEMRQRGRVAVDLLSREARLAGYMIDNLPQAVTTASPTTLQFAADIDDGDAAFPCDAASENAVDGGAERITYNVNAGQLLRSVDCWNGTAWTNAITDAVMVEHLVANQVVFRYFDSVGNEIAAGATLSSAQRDLIRSIHVSIDMEDTSKTQQVGPDYHTNYQITGQIIAHNLQ